MEAEGRNPWTEGRVPGVEMYPTLGAWQNRRKLASAAWVPPQWVRMALWGAHLYWQAFPSLTIAGSDTSLTRTTTNEDLWIFAILGKGSSALANSFRVQIFEDESDYLFSKYEINQLNMAPIAQEPGLLRLPHFLSANSPVLCSVLNLDTVANTVNIALFGYSRWFR